MDIERLDPKVVFSLGYLDLECFRRHQLTDNSDLYSFGVVLLEFLCAREKLNLVFPREQFNIEEWEMHWQKKGKLEENIDPHLVGTFNPGSLKMLRETTKKFLEDMGFDRASIGDVLWNLEYEFQLQDISMHNDLDDNSKNHIANVPLHYTNPEPFVTSSV